MIVILMDAIPTLLPLLSLVILLLGIKLQRGNYIVVSLWLSLIALVLHYEASGGEILGSYFNYLHALFYSLNLILLISSISYLLSTSLNEVQNKFIRSAAGLIPAGLITGGLLLIANLWVNAVFVENKLPGTPILQVATFNRQPYCDYKYVFYKVDKDNVVKFMCPNHYGLLPSIGRLDTAPGFVVQQLPIPLQVKFQHEQNSL